MNTPAPPPPSPPPPLPPGNAVVRSADGTVVSAVTRPDGTKTVTIHRPGEPPVVVTRSEDAGPSHALWVVIAALAIVAGLIGLAARARRARRGAAKRDLSPERERDLLAAENDRLKGQVTRLEERVAVLERIATDPGRRIADEIDSLR